MLQSSSLTKKQIWTANCVIYGSVYLYIFNSIYNELYILYYEVRLLTHDMPSNLTSPLKMKFFMFVFYLFLITASIIMEVIIHNLLINDESIWILITVYEISNFIIFAIIAYIFQPTEYNPFFFMKKATMDDRRARPIPILQANTDYSSSNDIELQSLLSPEDLGNYVHSKLIVLKTHNDVISMGLSSATPQQIPQPAISKGIYLIYFLSIFYII